VLNRMYGDGSPGIIKIYGEKLTPPQKKRATKETCRRDLEKNKWTAGFWYSWRKMEAAAQNRAGAVWSVVCAPLGASKQKS